MPLPKLKYIVAPSVDFMLKQSYPNTEEEDPSKFVLPMPQSIRVNLVCRGALVGSDTFGDPIFQKGLQN